MSAVVLPRAFQHNGPGVTQLQLGQNHMRRLLFNDAEDKKKKLGLLWRNHVLAYLSTVVTAGPLAFLGLLWHKVSGPQELGKLVRQPLPPYDFQLDVKTTSAPRDSDTEFEHVTIRATNMATFDWGKAGTTPALEYLDDFERESSRISGFYQLRLPDPIILEADVSDAIYRDLLVPCWLALNSWLGDFPEDTLKNCAQPANIVSLRTQWTRTLTTDEGISYTSRVDHALTIMHEEDGKPVEKCLVLIEEKRPGSIGLPSSLNTEFKTGRMIQDSNTNWRQHLSQLVKYRETWNCDQLFFTDLKVHLGMIIETEKHPDTGKEMYAEPNGGLLRHLRYWRAEGTKTDPTARETLLYLAYRGLKNLDPAIEIP